MNSAITITKLNHYYGQGDLQKQVLFDINLEIKTGEIIILTGPSGSGKTTLLSLIGGLRSPQFGSLKILERELCGASNKERVGARRKLGYIFQAHNLLEFLTAQQNVMMPLELHDVSYLESMHKAEIMLQSVGLGNRINYYPGNLSSTLR